jgi:hypothetical protein
MQWDIISRHLFAIFFKATLWIKKRGRKHAFMKAAEVNITDLMCDRKII